VLFGSAAAGDFLEGTSSYDLLVVCEQLGTSELDALAATIRGWRKARQPLPLLFTPPQLAAAANAFAIEFSDMQQARRVLYGNDPIADMTIDAAYLRVHLERELKGKLLALRNRYVLAAGDQRRIMTVLSETLSTFLSLFRASLRLYERDAPNHKLDALRALAEHIDFDPQPFFDIAEFKMGRRAAKDYSAATLFSQYWQAIDAVTRAVDQWIHSDS
jgi:hypothetical protein